MLVDLLSPSNYGSYNIYVAQAIGLSAAVYLSELMNINSKAIRKNKMQDDSFIVDRAYLTQRTTLSEKEQKTIEESLLKLGILEKGDNTDNKISINVSMLTTLLMDTNEKLLTDISKIQASTSKATKGQKIVENLKTNIVCTNTELHKAYEEWIDAVYSKESWMSKKAVIAAQQVVDDFSQHNLDVALKVLEIATINGYRDVSWAVNTYKKDYGCPPSITVPAGVRKRTELGSKVF